MPSARVEDEEDAEILTVCLQAALFLSRCLSGPGEVPPPREGRPGAVIPLVAQSEPGVPVLSTAVLPPHGDLKVPAPRSLDEFTVRQLRRSRAAGTWQCALYCCTSTLNPESTFIPAGPVALRKIPGRRSPPPPRETAGGTGTCCTGPLPGI